MKEKVINQMTQIVRDVCHDDKESYCWQDFEGNLRTLANYDGEFIWHVRPSGTSLNVLNPIEMVKLAKENEAYRYGLKRSVGDDPYIYECDKSLFFHYDRRSASLVPYSKEEYKALWRECVSFAWEAFKTLFPEIKMVEGKIPVKYECDLAYVKEQVKFAKENGYESPIETIKGFRRYARCANDHYVSICKDPYSEHGFCFAEMINGKCNIFGGIILHIDKKNNTGRWCVHT